VHAVLRVDLKLWLAFCVVNELVDLRWTEALLHPSELVETFQGHQFLSWPGESCLLDAQVAWLVMVVMRSASAQAVKKVEGQDTIRFLVLDRLMRRLYLALAGWQGLGGVDPMVAQVPELSASSEHRDHEAMSQATI
jgi:hypothetical protein